MKNYSNEEKQFLIAFGIRVRQYRLDKEITQEELSEMVGLHRTYIGSIERGERNVSLLNIYKIAAALEVQPSKLIEDME